MAIIDQSEIDELLAQADNLATEANEVLEDQATAVLPEPNLATFELPKDPDVRRILRIRVPVIVQLAKRVMPISAVRDLSVGAIIEFEKSVEDRLDLMINNRLVGHGSCVKVGENFGLRVMEIVDLAQRIRSMGGD